MSSIIDYRGGKKRVQRIPEPVTYYVDPEIRQDALDNGYINPDGTVTDKFRSEYGDMFDVIGYVR